MNKLKAMNSNHKHLDLLQGELSKLKDSYKSVGKAHTSICHHQAKWARDDCGPAEIDVSNQMEVLQTMWAELEDAYVEQLRVCRGYFQSISEATRANDDLKAKMKLAETKEKALRKKLKPEEAQNNPELRQIGAQINSMNESLDVSQTELVKTKVTEYKRYLIASAEANMLLASQMRIVSSAQKQLALQLPDTNEYANDQLYSATAITEEIINSTRVDLKENNDNSVEMQRLSFTEHSSPLSRHSRSQSLSSGYSTLPPLPQNPGYPQPPYPLPDAPPPAYNPHYPPAPPGTTCFPGQPEFYIGGSDWQQGHSATIGRQQQPTGSATSASRSNSASTLQFGMSQQALSSQRASLGRK